ncbi:MAG: S41 family peptidase [Prevotellaceae bacterium]|jgi:carboxyl-terminal processing protease|nr:S41 family peptidase [Prevotellaceae bacterium]
MKKLPLSLSLSLCLAATALQAQPQMQTPEQAQAARQVNETAFKFGRFLYYLSALYVDTVNVGQLAEQALTKVLSELDPHSSYTSAKDAKAVNEELRGDFDGIGIEFSMLHDTVVVVSPIAGGPSQKLGIAAGDRIVEVDGKNVAGVNIKNTDMMKLLRGPKGTIVSVQVLRRGVEQLLDFTITRDKIPIYSIDAKFWAKPGIAYIHLGRFAASSHSELLAALKELGKTPEGLILDLRGNSGGLLDAAIYIADELLAKDKLIVYTEGRAIPRTDAVATDTLTSFERGKLVILIDEHSASSSEIVAGAIQDWDRGLIVGRRSFGKGLIQNQLELPDGSLVRITVARYHTPTGRVIQRPYDNGKIEKYYRDLQKRYTSGEVYSLDSIKFPDSLMHYTLANRRTVYGGGGIMPDVFIPLDTSSYTPYHAKLVRMGILNRFALSYMDKNRKLLEQQYATFPAFNSEFSMGDSLFSQLLAFAEEQKLPRSEDEIAKSKHDIAVQFKGFVAQDLFTSSAFYEVVYPVVDEGYKKAVDIMEHWDSYGKLLNAPADKAQPKSKKKK